MFTWAKFALNACSCCETSVAADSCGRTRYVAGNMNPSMFRWWPKPGGGTAARTAAA